MKQNVNVSDQITLHIEKMGINGEGIGYHDQLAIFVDFALPEEDCLVEITEVFDNRAVAKVIEIYKESKYRITPICPVYGRCGGCQTQHFDYDMMLNHKKEMIINAYKRYIKSPIDQEIIKDVIQSPKIYHYRNKAALPVRKLNGKNRFGMYMKHSNVFIPIDDCPIQNETINEILQSTVLLMDQIRLDAYDPKTKKGAMHSIIVRIAEYSNEVQVSFILLKADDRTKRLAKLLVGRHPMIESVFEVIHKNSRKQSFFDGDIYLLYGKQAIVEHLNEQEFLLRPEAFFQLNTPQADMFYREMKRMAGLKKYEVAIDAYAGIAPVSHYIHDAVHQVYAIEIDEDACQSAKLSLERNDIKNVTVLRSDFHKALVGLKNKKVDVMFFDPPRSGLGEKTIESIIGFLPKRLVYGSCNPSTLAKDLNLLLEHYDLIETQPLDMFPQTSLVESISLLVRKPL
ncbi:MAG: 23S rRNA (uracil(1939)-C(5))-methyltransferase RlmD [Acholeplasmataceae bacterium]